MKLLSQTSREYKGKEYTKYWIIIPNKLIEKLGWTSGEDLEVEIKEGKLVIERD
jgi:AbrB family looped-hinge helix DNA binding protein